MRDGCDGGGVGGKMTAETTVARRLDGNVVAAAIRESLGPRVQAFTASAGRPPGLAIVLAGHDGGSETYVRNKMIACETLGVAAVLERVADDASVDAVLEIVDRFNRTESVDGILVQSPLPAGMGRNAEQRVFDAIHPDKDVDGFTPINAGRLTQNRPGIAPGTPSGVIELLDRAGIPIAGRHAVVIGRSDIVGKPMAMLLLHRHATVTICHSRTVDLPAIAATADILVAAVGRPGFVTRDFVKPGATVIDVGTTWLRERDAVVALFGPDSPRLDVLARRGHTVVGDVHPEVAAIAGALTPVPGGVGPLTITMLLSNTLRAAELRRSV
ncbi:MAG: bifunctional 5,10-methylenetetrahydrofolate dehydrogenase/5,10-methenyltetrahydrofolate cyclohydrolase [Acidobacteria bacterium]|nr:bifunctional 5,10-methylenetetrahydrofolate dehydrogenase/5,10-methenyltetrahydrofolate cyclohydrolase [Acidobacteriota bacterium]